MISEIDNKTKNLLELKKDSNFATYLNMNNMFVEDMKKHYLPNLEYIESVNLDKYLGTFHKFDKSLPESDEVKSNSSAWLEEDFVDDDNDSY